MTAGQAYIPHAVVQKMVDGSTPVRAWREHLALTRESVAQRMGVSREQYDSFELSEPPDAELLRSFAAAVGLAIEQVDV